ncbi:DUF899 family protein [Salibacterium sp. K-3]
MFRDGDKVYETYWTTGRGNERMPPSYGLLDLTPTAGRSSGKIRPRAGRSIGGPKVVSFSWTAVRPPSGPAGQPDVPTISAPRLPLCTVAVTSCIIDRYP